MKTINLAIVILALLLSSISLGCKPQPHDWQWVEVASYSGTTQTNDETLLVYVVNGATPELWTMGSALRGQGRKIFTLSKDGEQATLPVEIYDFSTGDFLQVSRIFKYEQGKVFVSLVYNLSKK